MTMMTELPAVAENSAIGFLQQSSDSWTDANLAEFRTIPFDPNGGALIPSEVRSNITKLSEADPKFMRDVDLDDTLLIASELATNPERHTDKPPTSVALGRFSVVRACEDGSIVRSNHFGIFVTDAMPSLKGSQRELNETRQRVMSSEPNHVEAMPESGRGSLIVEMLADESGFIQHELGKTAVAIMNLGEDHDMLIPSRQELVALAS